MQNRFLFLVFWVVIAGIGCGKKQKAEMETLEFSISDTMMARCEFHTVASEQVKSDIRFFGKIEPDYNKVAQVYSLVGGNISAIYVELGDYVVKGQVMAVVRSGEVASWEKEKLDAENDLAAAEKDLQVSRDLFAGKLISEKELVASQAAWNKAKGELDRIQELYAIYHLGKGSLFEITAPISGYVISKQISQNEQLRSDKSDILFSVADINEVWVIANVSESEISRIKIGQETEITTLSFPDEKYTGQIDKIFNRIDPETKAMKIRVRLPNPDLKLKPDMIATMNVHFREEMRMPVVPASSVIFDKNRYWVMVFRSRDEIDTRSIEIHRQSGDSCFVSSGIKDGETVITRNAIFIYDAIND